MQRAASTAVAALVPVAMLSCGVVAVLSSDLRASSRWPVWAGIALGLCVAAGVVWVYGLNRWRAVVVPTGVRLRSVVLVAAAVATAGVLALAVPLALGTANARGFTLAAVALVGATPVGAAAFGIRAAALAVGHRPEPDHAQMLADAAALLRLRRALQRLAGALGALVSLSTLALGAGIRLTETMAAETVLIFGIAGSFGVAAFYAPAAAAIRARAEHLAATLFDGSAASSGADVVTALEHRAKLEQLLGADRSVLADLQIAIPVLTPLIAGAAAFLTR